MKKFHLFIPGLLFCFTCFAQEIWTVDSPHSNIRFEVGWENISTRTGEFKVFEGQLTTNSISDLSNATFYLKVDPKGIDVIADRLSERLKGVEFFEVEIFPEITYYSFEVKPTSDSTYVSKGQLNIHGVEKDQDVLIWVRGHKTGEKGHILGLEVSLTLSRKDFGLDWGSPRLGETVKVVCHLLYKLHC
jgi:polyisoprenoid-binding protein YceI